MSPGVFDLTWIAAVAIFAVSTCGTPGPNNMLIMASGSTFGFARSVPGIAGINVGFPLMVVLVGAGVVDLLSTHAGVLVWLRPVAVAYLLWLAWGVATAPPPDRADSAAPAGFWRLFGFQAVNPKSWVMVLGALVAYSRPDAGMLGVVMIALVFGVFGTPCTVAWCALGATTRRVIRSDRGFRAFNVTMGVLLAASAVALLYE